MRCARLAWLGALVRTQWRQMIRDPASIAVGVMLPVILILLFGYTLSLEAKNVPIAVLAQELLAREPGDRGPWTFPVFQSAERHLAAGRRAVARPKTPRAILTVPPEFARRASSTGAAV
ncbi:MAG: hypothetical protein ACP5PN_04225 [Steroidobacteraceae bacterium]